MKNNNLKFLTCFIWLRSKCQQPPHRQKIRNHIFGSGADRIKTETVSWDCEESAFEFSISRQPPRFKVMVLPPNARPIVSPYSQAKDAQVASFLLHKSQDEAPGQVKTHSCYSVHSSNLKWDILSSSHQRCCCRSLSPPSNLLYIVCFLTPSTPWLTCLNVTQQQKMTLYMQQRYFGAM